MWSNPQFPADLVTFTEDILNRKFHFCPVISVFGNVTEHLDMNSKTYKLFATRYQISPGKMTLNLPW